MTKPKKKPAPKKGKAGAQTKYNPLYHPTMIRLAAQTGLINDEIAKEIGICKKTLHLWKNKYPEVDEALARGKEEPNKTIEQDAFDCAHGYYFDEEQVYFYRGHMKRVKVRKYAQKNPVSVMFWLKNRMPEKYKDRHEVDITQPVTIILPNDPRAKKLVKKDKHGDS